MMVETFDSFEDGEMSEYNRITSKTTNWDITNTNAYDGSKSLDLNTDDSYDYIEFIHQTASISVSDNKTPFGAYFKFPDIDDDATRVFEFGWAFQSRTTHFTGAFSFNGYGLRIQRGGMIFNVGGGEGADAESNYELTPGKYYRVEVSTWDADGNITARVVDPADDTIEGSISSVDSQYTSGAWPAIGYYGNPPLSDFQP